MFLVCNFKVGWVWEFLVYNFREGCILVFSACKEGIFGSFLFCFLKNETLGKGEMYCF